MKSSIEELEIYNKTVELSNLIWNLVIKWDHFPKSTIGNQLVRAIDSVSANIAEGYGRGSKIDNARFTKIARGSLFETKHWIIQSAKRKLINEAESKELINQVENLLPRISAYINFLLKSSDKK